MTVNTVEISGHKRFVNAVFDYDGLNLHLRLDPDAVKGSDLGPDDPDFITGMKTLSHLLTLFIAEWDADDPPTPEYLNTLPITFLVKLHTFCWEQVCSLKEDVRDLRRFIVSGGGAGYAPPYYWDILDARLLNMKPWEIAGVPMVWRLRARAVDKAEKQARLEIAKKAKVPASYILEI